MSATPPLDEWLALYDADDNEWWGMDAGHHLNLFDEAVDRMRSAEAAVRRVLGDLRWLESNPNGNLDTMTHHVIALRMLDLLADFKPTATRPDPTTTAETNEGKL